MISSMTGYGRAQNIIGGKDITVEIKSVNHRFFEFSAKLPRNYGYLEEKLKSFIQSNVSRGKVDVSVTIFNVSGAGSEVEMNTELAEGYIKALREFNASAGLSDDIALSNVARFPEVFNVKKAEENEDEIWNAVKEITEVAVDKFVCMRRIEGEKLKQDLETKLDFILSKVEVVEERSPQTVSAYRKRLYDKLSEILENSKFDEQRILTEAALFAEKIAVDEETVRLRSHIEQFGNILEDENAVGRKLDFLVQEINREVNTIGSKAQDTVIAKTVIDMKSEIEKIREQIQNLE